MCHRLFSNEEFENIKVLKTIKTKRRRLEEFQEKIASLKFLDPAAGSGNFLAETYIFLRKLENKIFKELRRNFFDFKARIILHFKLKPVSSASKTMQNKKHSKAT